MTLPHSVFAQDDVPRTTIYVAGPENNPTLTQHMTGLLAKALGQGVSLRPFESGQTSQDSDSLAITLGPEAFTQVRQESRSVPILALMVDSAFIEGYFGRSEGRVGAVLYSPPLIRQVAAGKAILPHATHVAMLATPESVELYEGLMDQLADLGMEGRVFIVSQNDNLIPTLIRALGYGDFLLAAPDSDIYNPRTIKHVLLTTYRRNRIVIGPSRAYVRAGALASNYAPLKNIADEAAQQVAGYQQAGRFPAPSYPDTFKLEINRQVARSLNIPLPTEEELRAAIELRLSSLRESNDE
ncbi:ABC transporter substrate-binding protein [Marinobacter sp.]|uniref:ABC transporter substrate-binding protein n=1 Tax=Marinobacter sp. TaxID=50741 RepID=UPI0034A4EFFF